MNLTIRTVLSALGVAFTGYLAVAGLLWTKPVDTPWMLIVALVLYLPVTWVCILAPSTVHRDRPRLPVWAAGLALLALIVVPNLTWLGAGADARAESFVTWSLGGLGALMAIVMVRGRAWVAWAGVVLLAVESSLWIGVVDALAFGITGAIVWVGVAQLLTWLMAKAARDTAELTDMQREATEWLATQDGRRRERRVQVQRALAIAGPILTRTIDTGGALDEDDRAQALLAEGKLRDELRGPRLLDDDVRARLDQARRRGCMVTMLDEGGLEDFDEDALSHIRSQLAAALDDVHSERIYIRTSPDPTIAVTVVGRSRTPEDPDGEDVVDLWEEIARPDAS